MNTGFTPGGDQPMTEPPEGVLAGEDVPVGSEPDEVEQTKIDRMAGILKHREPYSQMTDEKRREIAINKLQKAGEIQ